MSALEAGEFNVVALHADGCRGEFVGDFDGGVQAAGAADVEFALRLGVHVQENVALQLSGLQVGGSGHAGLLVHGDEGLKRSVHQVVGLHHAHGGGHAYSVVRTQGGAVGANPAVLTHPHFNGVGQEIMLFVRVFLRNHVNVPLQDGHLAVFHARCGRLPHDDVADSILTGVDVVLFCPFHQGGGNFFFVFGRMGNGAYLLEILPY